ncbi:ATPase [Pandoraea eparura]|jgi:predicted kinase|uniref:ATPase n=1 Tax=Pandoraea eparura TaxID=2508291 RepID=A0A5E4UKE9_9BURK|nr:ATP-binding protein [Pandoraea eparura]VVD99314.1 ATPase [Pandoraea eparura]
MTRLVFFCGHAGAGKTTLAKRLIGPLIARSGEAFCLLDKDTLYGAYSASVMGALTGNPNDRDSPVYLQTLRDPEYAGLLDTARENLRLGVNVLVVGPFSRELREGRLFDRAWLGVDDDVGIHVVWVELDEANAKARIVSRGNPNDAYKLAHWDDYRLRRFSPSVEAFPQLVRYDNTAPTADDDERLLQTLLAPTR